MEAKQAVTLLPYTGPVCSIHTVSTENLAHSNEECAAGARLDGHSPFKRV